MKAMSLRLTLAVAATSLLFACDNATEVATYGNKVYKPLEFVDSCGITVMDTVEYYSSCREGADVMAKVNGLIVDLCYGDEFAGLSVPDAAKASAEECVSDYLRFCEELAATPAIPEETVFPSMASLNYEYRRLGKFTTSYGNLRSYEIFNFAFTGGAHGNYGWTYLVFDTKTGDKVTTDDLFREDSGVAVTELLKEALAEVYGPANDDGGVFYYGDAELFTPNVKVSEEGVTWCYNPYEIAPYSSGVLFATVGWDALAPYLK